jgi:alanine-glyoxylate transaminase / serine-glyoxylate transaminase / serine-pyruvate transaminase
MLRTASLMPTALSAMQGEGLDKMWSRHADMHHMLWDGLSKMGLDPLVKDPEHRLVTINTIKVRHRFVK